MRTLILFRHGKSDWEAPYDADHDRPLADRGRNAAQLMGRLLAQIDQVPELAISSSALRARDTLQLAARSGGWTSMIRIDSALYATTADEVLRWMHTLGRSPASLLLTGHEPTWSDLAGQLIGRAIMRVPTGAMLRIDFAYDSWQLVDFGSGELRWLIPPKLAGQLKGSK